MDRQRIHDKIKEIIAYIICDPSVAINEDSKLVDDLGFGSIDVLALVDELESNYGSINIEKMIQKCSSVRDIIEQIYNMKNSEEQM